MNSWKVSLIGKKPLLKDPIFIEGLPGIGNVGKVAVDFIIEEMKAIPLYDLFSYTFPHSVFVKENNLVELPSIKIYYKKHKKHDLLFLAGDVQPIDEVSSYEFSDLILDLALQYHCKEIITLGGIGLQDVPKKPKVYCTGNSREIINRYKKDVNVNEKLYGVVGPIIGVSGLLLGLSEKKKIKAISFLAETYGHPLYLGIKGAYEILGVLNKKLDLKVDVNKLKKEVEEIESEMVKRTKEFADVSKQTAIKKLKSKFKEMDYIG
jgi:uncharacterized protein (TIGR00162 family)